jgi:hypothetical protein
MYSFTRLSTETHDARMQNGIRKVVSMMKRQREAVDADALADDVAEPGARSTNWNSGLAGSKRQTRRSATEPKVTSVANSAIMRMLRPRRRRRRAPSGWPARAEQRQEGDDR